MAKQTVFVCLLAFWAPWTSVASAEESSSSDGDVAALEKQLQKLKELLKAQKEAHDAEIKKLNERIEEIERSRPPAVVGKPEPFGKDELAEALDELREDAKAKTTQTDWFELARAFQNFNPDISVIGDFVGHYDSREGGELDDKWLFRELELGISGSVDPYARADAFIGIHRAHEHEEHEVHAPAHAHAGSYDLHLEEAYLTFLTLPWDLQAKVGKFRAKFGKVNTMHVHSLPWVEHPLVIRNYFGHGGLAGEGASISWLVPNRWDKYIELTYENFNNDGPHLFAGEEADDFVHLLHLKNFFDLTGSSTLELGLSAATAPNDDGHGSRRTWLEGADVTYKWRHPRQGLYKAFMWQTEVMAAQKELEYQRICSMGLFSAAEYQFARRWTAGGRFDFSELPDDADMKEHAYSVYLTFLQSEYCFWRLGYQFSHRNFEVHGDNEDHQVFLQVDFGLGPHRAHKY